MRFDQAGQSGLRQFMELIVAPEWLGREARFSSAPQKGTQISKKKKNRDCKQARQLAGKP